MIYVFIDTNIYIRLLTNSDDNQLFNNLKVLVNDGIIKLLVPEIVLLELNKENSSAINKFNKEFSTLKANIKDNCKSIWSEVRDIESKLNDLIDEEAEIKQKRWEENYMHLIEFLNSKNVNVIEFTPEIMCSGQKRIISGNMKGENPYRSSQDAYNIECLIKYFSSIETSVMSELLICTNDTKDFAKEKKVKKGEFEKEEFEINDIIKREFTHPKGFRNINTLMKYIDLGYEDITLINDNVDTECADTFYLDEINTVNKYKKHLDKKLNYNNPILKKYREDIINYINKTLLDVRNLDSFDDRSELKLHGIFENRLEIEIEISRLSTLIKIKNNLYDYKKIHEKMHACTDEEEIIFN